MLDQHRPHQRLALIVAPTITPSPTVRLAPSPTAVPPGFAPPAIGATLGGTPPQLNEHYGPPTLDTSSAIEYRINIDGTDVLIATDLDFANDGLKHVSSLTISPIPGSGVQWDDSTRDRLTRLLLPKDSADDGVDGAYHRYHSDALAQVFSSRYFVDPYGNGVRAGSFYLMCHASFCAARLGSP